MRTATLLALLPVLALLGCEGALAIEAAQALSPGPDGRPTIDLENPPPPPSVILDDAGGGGGVDAGVPRDGGGGPPPSCVPECQGRECGSDGCGGTCAPGCGSGETCGASGQCVAQSSMCPPSGGEGTNPGEVSPDFSVPLAAGGTTSVRGLCSARTSWIYRYSASCGICRNWLENSANAIYDELHSQGLEMVVLVGTAQRADGSYGPGDAESAAALRDELGLHMPVAYEPNNEMLWALYRSGAGVSLVMTEGNVIALPIGRVSDSQVRSVVQGAP